MAATGTPTPNIGLRIPLGTDPASVDDINYNSTLIDTKLGAVGNDSVQDQLDDLNSNITIRPIGEVVYVSGSTDSSGLIEITITNAYVYAFAVTNVSKTLANAYSVTADSWNNTTKKLKLRIRSMGDNSVIANTTVGFDVMIIGF